MNTARLREHVRMIADHAKETEEAGTPDVGAALADIADLLEDLERRVERLEKRS